MEAAPPRLPACLIRNAGWLYSGLVAVTSRTAAAESRAPSFDVIETVPIIFLRQVDLVSASGETVRIIAQPLTSNAFAPYGDVLAPPADFGRAYFEKGLRSGRTTAWPTLSVRA
jgi:hypothetical protein